MTQPYTPEERAKIKENAEHFNDHIMDLIQHCFPDDQSQCLVALTASLISMASVFAKSTPDLRILLRDLATVIIKSADRPEIQAFVDRPEPTAEVPESKPNYVPNPSKKVN